MSRSFPRIEIDIAKLKHNAEIVTGKCRDEGITVAGVVKGFTGVPEAAEALVQGGCKILASSRIEQLKKIRRYGVNVPMMLIRIPMISEAYDTIKYSDISLNSEIDVLRALNSEAEEQNKYHKVILMDDLGDLREGYWDREELLQAALIVENELDHLYLSGIGTNLGCYGAIAATADKLNELVSDAEYIEEAIGRKLEYISGGATSSYIRILAGDMPERINMLRIGEGILLARDLDMLWGYDMSEMYQDVFTLKAEIMEIKQKPSYPQGEIMFDAYGNKPEYEDLGVRKRALLGIGKVDYAFTETILPRCEGVKVIGASSDHTIIDITDVKEDLKIGDILEFDLCYASIVYATNTPSIKVIITGREDSSVRDI